MSKHCIELEWRNVSTQFNYNSYLRTHQVRFKEGQGLTVSAAADFLGQEQYADPEQLLLAALSSCHMLTFLAICAKSRIGVKSYQDHAEAFLEPNEKATEYALSKITLNPRVEFLGPCPDQSSLQSIHEKSHKHCFIAKAIKTPVKVLL